MRSPGSEVKVQQHEHLNWGFSQQHSLFFDNGREGKHPRVASIYFLDILFFFGSVSMSFAFQRNRMIALPSIVGAPQRDGCGGRHLD